MDELNGAHKALVAELKLVVEESVGRVRTDVAVLQTQHDSLGREIGGMRRQVNEIRDTCVEIEKKVAVEEAVHKAEIRKTAAIVTGGGTISLLGLWKLAEHLFGSG